MSPPKALSGFGLMVVLVTAQPLAFAQTVWTGAGDSVDWSDPGNWSNGLPSPSNGAVFDNNPTGVTGLLEDFTIASLTFNPGIGAHDEIVGVGWSTLTVNGSIVNNTGNEVVLDIPVRTGNSNPVWDGPLTFANDVTLGTGPVTLVGDVQFRGSNLNFEMTDPHTYGRFVGPGTGNFSGVTINFTGSLTGVAFGASFDFTTGSFTGATLNVASLPLLPSALVWDTSRFLSQGIISAGNLAFPEPSAWSALAGGVAFGFAVCRRRGVRSECCLK